MRHRICRSIPCVRMSVARQPCVRSRASGCEQSVSHQYLRIRDTFGPLRGQHTCTREDFSLVRKHVEHMTTFLFDIISDLSPKAPGNEKCVDYYLLSPNRPN